MRKNVITLFVGILLLGIPMVYAGKPVKNMDLYLCIGQSNMAGRGKLSPAVMDTMPNNSFQFAIFHCFLSSA